VRCGRSSVDALGQGLEAALGGGDVVVLGPEWPEALYYKAYCLVELGDPAQAKSLLQKALELMPGDPMYLCELGDLILRESAWQQAYDTFEQARASAETMAAEPDGAARSPGGRTPAQWQGRALRGKGTHSSSCTSSTTRNTPTAGHSRSTPTTTRPRRSWTTSPACAREPRLRTVPSRLGRPSSTTRRPSASRGAPVGVGRHRSESSE